MARMPPATLGCKVFTRPSSISGNPVTSATSLTGTPASRIILAIPPVETISAPRPLRPRANSTTPVLSVTLMRTRLILGIYQHDSKRHCTFSLPPASDGIGGTPRMRTSLALAAAALLLAQSPAHAQESHQPLYKVQFDIHEGTGPAAKVRRYSLVATANSKSTFNVGSRVPVATGSSGSG